MNKKWTCTASGEKYTSYANTTRKRPDGTIQCPVCGKVVKLAKQGLDRWPGTLPQHHDERGKSSGRGSSYPVLPVFPGRKIGAKLVPVPAPLPPSASDERETVQCNCPGGTKSAALHAQNCPVRLRDAVLIDPYDGGTWVAHSPGVDAAEQKPVYTIQVRGSLHTWEPTAQAFKLANGTYNLYAAPSPGIDAAEQKPIPGTVAWVQNGIANFIADNWPMRKHTLAEIEAGIRAIEIRVPPFAAPSPAASADEWMAEAERLIDDVLDRYWDSEKIAAIRAHLKARP